MWGTGNRLGRSLLLLAALLCGCHEQPASTATTKPSYLLAESRGKAQARAWRLAWLPGKEEPRADWVITGRHMQACLRVDAAGGTWSLLDHAGKRVRETAFAWEPPLQDGEELLFVREPGLFHVARGQRVVHSVALPDDVWDDDFWRLPASTALRPQGQKLGPAVFADDFAHAEGEFGPWQAEGEWSIEAMRNPLRSANAFRLLGTRAPASLVTGPWFWRNYQFGVSVQCPADGGFSLLAYRAEPDTAYELAVTPSGAETLLRLLRRCQGTVQEIGRCSRSPMPGWNRLALAVHEDLVEASVNGQVLLQCVDPEPLVGGGIGLQVSAAGTVGIEFDDAEVAPAEEIRLSANRVPASRLVDRNGDRRTLMSPLLRDSSTRLALPAVAVGELHGVQLLARLDPAGSGLRLTVADGGAGNTRLTLSRLEPGGGDLPLAEGQVPATARAGSLGLQARGDDAWATLDGRAICSASSCGDMEPGRSGFVLPPGLDREGVSLRVEPNPPPPDLHALNHAFTGELSMETWSVEAAEWQEVDPPPDHGTIWLHRSDLWADFRVALPLGNGSGIEEFLLCRDSDTPAAPFLSLTVADGKLVLHAGADQQEIGPAPLGRIECEKRLDQLLVRAGSLVLWTGKAPAGSFWRLALRASRPERDWLPLVAVGASSLKDYTFTKAPVDWLPASGRWAVTNRWQCDPRWSFYTGRNLAGTAANWFRYEHGKNVTLEFFAGPRMNRESGDNYDYARDLNATLVAVAGNLDSGYSFLFGGKGNTGSQITHGEQILHANPAMRIPEDKALVHRHWFHIKIRKQGNHLAWWVDGAKVGEADTAEDTGAGRLALWTWRNQIAVARVRVSSDSLVRAADQTPGNHLAVRSAARGESANQEKQQ